MTRKSVLQWLRDAREELDTFNGTTYREDRWVRWHNEMRTTLRKVFGDDSHELHGYQGAAVGDGGRPIRGFGKGGTAKSEKRFDSLISTLGTEEEIDAESEKRFDEILSTIRGWLDALIAQIERFGIEGTSMVEKIPQRYLLTSPVYWVEWLTARFEGLLGFLRQHKVPSLLVGVVSLAASIVAILTGVGVL